jgi:hypothetical protein
MQNIVAGSLTSSKKRSSIFYVLKFKAISKFILENEAVLGFNGKLVRQIFALNSVTIASQSTSFFWLAVHRLYSSITNNDTVLIKQNIDYFAINGYDSFFKALPVNATFEITLEKGLDGILPKLGITLRNENGSYRYKLARKMNNKLSVTVNDLEGKDVSSFTISSNNLPVNMKIRKSDFESHPGIAILYEKCNSLFEEDYYKEINGDPIQALPLAEKVDEALNEIKAIDVMLYRRFINLIDFVVPIGNYMDVHFSSFSSPMLKNCLFTSIYIDGVFLVESLIHEFSHCELHYLMDTILISTEEETVQNYYSPWRRDPRPINGIIHGVYVFHAVLEFYTKWKIAGPTKAIEEKITIRIEIILAQLLMAVKQLDHSKLSEFSLDLINNVERSCYQIAKRCKVDLRITPQQILNHQVSWKKNFSELIIN